MELDETVIEAAQRELLEETGWDDIELYSELWTWEHDFTRNGQPVRQHERILLGRGPRRPSRESDATFDPPSTTPGGCTGRNRGVLPDPSTCPRRTPYTTRG